MIFSVSFLHMKRARQIQRTVEEFTPLLKDLKGGSVKLALVGGRLDAIATVVALGPVAGPPDVDATVLGRTGGQGRHFGLVDGGALVDVDGAWSEGVVCVKLLGRPGALLVNAAADAGSDGGFGGDLGLHSAWYSCGGDCHGESQNGEHGSKSELHLGGGGGRERWQRYSWIVRAGNLC